MELSKGAQKILKLLRNDRYDVYLEYEFSNLKGKKGVPLRYDFAILYGGRPAILIEYDGEAHFNQVKFFQKTKSKFKQAQERDREKNKYALLHNIPLYRIPYWEIDSIRYSSDIFNLKYKVTNKYHNDYLIAP